MDKNCKSCGVLKPYSEFYKDKTMKTGCINNCKPCELQRRKPTQLKNREKLLIAKRKYSKTEKAKSLKKRWNETDKGKNWAKVNFKNQISKFPIKRKARMAVSNALLTGKIKKKPCIICGTKEFIHAHHDDYTKPLEVIFLCVKHHHDRHKQLKLINHDFKGE